MKLLTKELLKRIPKLFETEHDPDPMVYTKFFFPYSTWEWYVIEFDGEENFFGLVDGHEVELGNFSLRELMRTQDHLGLPIERDISFRPCRLSELKTQLRK